MKYEEARELIQTGDGIFVRSRRGFLPQMTIKFTGSPYTHTGVAVWLGKGLWLAEINSGMNHLVPMSQLDGMDFDVYHCPVADREKVKKNILQGLRKKIKYNFWALIVIGFYDWVGLSSLPNSTKALVCSEYSNKTWVESDWPEPLTKISPRGLAEKLSLKLQVRN